MEEKNKITAFKHKIEKIISRFTEILQESPVEVLISLITFIYAVGIYENIITENIRYGFLMPLFFIFSFIVNRIFVATKHRLIYYLSFLPFFLFWKIDVSMWVVSIGYVVALVIAVLAILSFKQKRDNKKFVINAIQYASEAISSLFLMMTAYALIASIYFSIDYIFNIAESHEDFWAYTSFSIFIIGLPLTFLMLHQDNEESLEIEDSGLFNILFNYLVSPALLIYTSILYLYFVKILVLWSLPKGGIAYMVFAFIIVAVIAKACQPLLKKQSYNWFYNRFSFISLPALLMFWIGVGYRIKQYGLTEDRVFLLVCGFIMTACIGMFFTKRLGHYLYVTWIATFLLACFTYIPGITAKDLGIYSQKSRLNKAIKELNLGWVDGKLADTGEMKKEASMAYTYKMLYDSYRYLRNEYDNDYMQSQYGYKDEDILVSEIFPPELQSYIYDDIIVSSYETISYPEESIDISGFNLLYDSNPTFSGSRDSIYISTSKTEFNESLEQLTARQLEKIGYSQTTDPVSLKSIQEKAKEFLTIEMESSTSIFKNVNLYKENNIWEIDYINPSDIIILEK